MIIVRRFCFGDISITVCTLPDLPRPDLEQPHGVHKQTGDCARRRLRPGSGDLRVAARAYSGDMVVRS
jgi:hypothetical protein